MDDLTANDHLALLTDLAALWQKARAEAASLISDAEAKAKSIEQEAATAFANAEAEAAKILLTVRHDIATGAVRLFHLVEVAPPQA